MFGPGGCNVHALDIYVEPCEIGTTGINGSMHMQDGRSAGIHKGSSGIHKENPSKQ
jgi:hypothetical protein